MKYVCPHGCEVEVGMSDRGHPGRCKKHGEVFRYSRDLTRGTPINRVSEGREGEVRWRGSTLKRGAGFSASKAQQEKVRGLPCVACDADPYEGATIDPAHLWPRRMGGCEDPLCVVPLCRRCHELFEVGALDLLSRLVDRKYFAEMAHPIKCHEISPSTLLRELTGQEVQFVERGAGVPA
jgi:hypothetical protein